VHRSPHEQEPTRPHRDEDEGDHESVQEQPADGRADVEGDLADLQPDETEGNARDARLQHSPQCVLGQAVAGAGGVL